jgi:hypothetical protein
MSTVETECTTYQFTLPGGDPLTLNGVPSVGVQVRLFHDGGVSMELNHIAPIRAVTLSLEQFNQLRAKVFEVTGKVV